MAQIVTIKQNQGYSNQIVSALEMIRQGMTTLTGLDQMRAEMIGNGTTHMQAAFGPASEGDAQALSDRWGYVAAKWRDPSDKTFSALRDLIYAVVVQ